MAGPDLFRGAMVSVAAFLIGTVVFGAYTAWRDRYTPAPRRLPLPCVLIFLASYVALLVLVIIERLARLGEGIGLSAVVTMLALLLNAFAMAMLVRFMQPQRRREAGRDGLEDG